MYTGDGCTYLQNLKTTELCTFKMGKMVTFKLYVFPPKTCLSLHLPWENLLSGRTVRS